MSSWTFIPPHHPQVECVPAFDDNYLWLILGPKPNDSKSPRAVVAVDPGDAQVINQRLKAMHYRLAAILITHHHADHIGGLQTLKDQWQCEVYGPLDSRIEGIDHVLDAGLLRIDAIDAALEVIEVPGHTLTHISYFAPQLGADPRPLLFCGDTLFAAGCGRLFEGSPAQMKASLEVLGALPSDTLVFCAHEYTVSNLKFAHAAFPSSAAIATRLDEAQAARLAGEATVPSAIGIERATNPFLLSNDSGCDAALQSAGHLTVNQAEGSVTPALERFTALREWKNVYR